MVIHQKSKMDQFKRKSVGSVKIQKDKQKCRHIKLRNMTWRTNLTNLARQHCHQINILIYTVGFIRWQEYIYAYDITCGDVLVCEHRTWQRGRNVFKFFPRHTHMIRRQLDKFHDFRNSFAFFTIKKPLPRKLAALPREHVDRNFETVPGFSLNLH